jgi:hypothetical protein
MSDNNSSSEEEKNIKIDEEDIGNSMNALLDSVIQSTEKQEKIFNNAVISYKNLSSLVFLLQEKLNKYESEKGCICNCIFYFYKFLRLY